MSPRRPRATAAAVRGTGTRYVPPPAADPAPADPALLLELADALLPAASWATWKLALRDIFGLPIAAAEQAVVNDLTGRSGPRTAPPAREVWIVCGRRAGKSQIAALVAVYLACFKQYPKARGERLVGMLLAADRRQARVLKSYIAGLLHAVPRLEALIVKETAEEIELSNGLTIETHTSSYKSTRGYSSAFVIGDEVAFWPDDGASESAAAVLTAVRPGLATTRGLLVCITTPYARSGIVWDTYRAHYGRADSPVYVLQAPTATMNPSLDAEIVRAAYGADPEAATAEFGGCFRSDLSNLFDAEVLRACVAEGRRELPPQPGAAYSAFVDSSGGSDEAFAVGIAHRTFEGKAIIDCLREWPSPFDPLKVVAEAAALVKRYRVQTVTGDRYSAEWIVSAFREHGVTYQPSERTKSELFIETVALVNSKQCELLDHPRLLAQLQGLQRRTTRSGKDSVDHRPHQRDDLANACAGALVLAVTGQGKSILPGDFTECINPLHLDRCPFVEGGSPWLPSDPTCRKHCPGARAFLPAYDAYRRNVQPGEQMMHHAQFLRQRYAVESAPFTRRAAWANFSRDLSQML